MKRPFRIAFAVALGLCMTALYWTGPDPDVCFDCKPDQNLGVAIAIFLAFTLIGLRLAKKIRDWERGIW